MNKCTLIIDGNWLLQSRFAMVKGFEINNPEAAKKAATQKLVDLMAKSINIVINKFKAIDNILLVTDGGSWRKSLPKPKNRANVVYKGTRKSSEEYDWTYIWKALEKITGACKEVGITCCNTPGAEGDDWVWYWSQKLSKEGTCSIIWSSDNDLKQLIRRDESGASVMWYNDRNGLFLHEDLNNTEIDYMDFFFSDQRTHPVVESIRINLPIEKVNYLQPDDIIVGKIICGDNGDNIKPCASYIKQTKTGEKVYSVTEKMWKEVADKYQIYQLNDIIGHEEEIANYIISIEKLKGKGIELNDVVDNIIYNTKLVWLSGNTIPQHIVDKMDEVEYKVVDIKYFRNNFKVLCGRDTELYNMVNEVEDLFG